MTTMNANRAAALTEAYHVIYDEKDRGLDDELVRITAYETLRYLGDLMNVLGVTVPIRRDGDGRPVVQ